MSAPVYINATEFMQLLVEKNLVIVPQSQLVQGAELRRQHLLKRVDLSLTEIVKAQFFEVKDTETLRRWCLAGKFGKDGFYQKKNGQYRVMTAAIKMVLYGI